MEFFRALGLGDILSRMLLSGVLCSFATLLWSPLAPCGLAARFWQPVVYREGWDYIDAWRL